MNMEMAAPEPEPPHTSPAIYLRRHQMSCVRRRPFPVARFSKPKMGWRAGATGYRLAPRFSGPRRAPAVANSGWCWRATPRSMAAIRCRPIPAFSSARRIPPLPAPQALSAPNCCACNSAAARGIESRPLRPHLSPPPVISRCPASKLSVPSHRPTGPAIAWRNAIGQEPRKNGNMKNQHRRIQQSRRVTVRLGILGACQGVRHLLKY